MIKYNAIAGRNLDRLAALSDGVFAFAMTLLVLDLHVPEAVPIHGERDLLRALGALAPRLVPYLMSFLTLGIFWVGQQTQFSYFARGNRHLAWIHLAFLFALTLMPFSTAFLATFITYRTALVVYWLNILLLGLGLYASWAYAVHARLLTAEASPDVSRAMFRRIRLAQLLYACGAALCAFNTYVSIGFIVLLQLNYALAPRIRFLYRL